jgi:hypothetical protein
LRWRAGQKDLFENKRVGGPLSRRGPMEALAPAARRLAQCGAAVALGWALRRSVFSDVDVQVRRSAARVDSTRARRAAP